MKKLLIVLAMAASLMLGCAPSDQAPPMVEATPTAAAADDQITNMDFESGEIEPPADVAEESAPQEAPDEQ